MSVQVWDFRAHIQNLVATPEIRARFNEIKPGTPPRYHSHDLGGEVFLVLDGEVTFDVEGEIIVCRAGQAIFVPPRVKHRVYNAGSGPARYYLSVTPHVEPTHTNYDENLQQLAPSYGGWRAAGNPNPPLDVSFEALADALVEDAEGLAAAANQTAATLRREVETLKFAARSGDRARLKAAADALWSASYPTLRQTRTFERTWNELAPRAMPTE